MVRNGELQCSGTSTCIFVCGVTGLVRDSVRYMDTVRAQEPGYWGAGCSHRVRFGDRDSVGW